MAYKILLVDDDADLREELKDFLDPYPVVEAANGEEALRILAKPHAIDLVILDIKMPGLPGIDVLKSIKQMSPTMKVIILTGNSSKEVAVDALKGHADDFIEKPFEIDKFHKLIQRFARGKDVAGESSSVKVGKMERVTEFLKVNYNKKVSLDDAAQEVCLSPKYLSRLFKEKTGHGFSDFRLKIKMQKAKDVLAHTTLTVEEISEKFGYKHVESFIRTFKKATGVTPARARAKTR